MRQVRMIKRRRPAWPAQPLPLDPRDPDIVRAKRLARSRSRQPAQARHNIGHARPR